MKSKVQREEDSFGFSKKSSLSPREALRAVQTAKRVEQERIQVLNYLLLRASLSSNLLEKRAWYIILSLCWFVERNHRFPSLKEQIQYLKEVLGDNIAPKLPALQKIDLLDSRKFQEDIRSISKQEEEEFLEAPDDYWIYH